MFGFLKQNHLFDKVTRVIYDNKTLTFMLAGNGAARPELLHLVRSDNSGVQRGRGWTTD